MDSGQLDKMIDQLERQFASPWSAKRDWKALWAVIREISANFKETRYPTRDERDAAWARFQLTVNNIKEVQTSEYEERNAHREQSASHLARIRHFAEAAEPDNAFGELLVHLATGGVSLIAKLAIEALLGKSDEEFQQLRARSEAMKSAWEYLSDHKTQMIGSDKAAAYSILEKTKGRLDTDWNHWKVRRQEIVADRNREHQARRDAREANQREWRARQTEFIKRLEGAEYKLEAALSHREEHLAKLIGQYESARSDEFRERVEGWMSEERANINSIETKLGDVRAKLSEARLRLDN